MSYEFAVIGNPIEHSLSPVIHALFSKQTGIPLRYEKILGFDDAFEKQIECFFSNKGRGLNVTLPFKERAFAMADCPTSRCLLARAANTLWVQDNQIYADNTDGIGLIRDLGRYTGLENKRILILGAGGAALGILPVLLELENAQIVLANRTLAKAEALKKRYSELQCSDFNDIPGLFDVIINATSSGTKGEALPLPMSLFSNGPFVYDLAYSIEKETPFVKYARSMGSPAVDGLGMLVEQAAESFSIWNGVKPETQPVLTCLRAG